MKKRAPDSFREYLLPTVLWIGLALALSATPWLQRLETVTLDNITRYRVQFQNKPDPRVVTVGIDDASINELGRWPWNREIHANFMSAISHGKPSLVAWDILFVDPSENDKPIQAGAAQLGGRVIFGAYSTDKDPSQPPPLTAANQPFRRIDGDVSRIPSLPFALRPIPQLQEVSLTAFCNATVGDDGVRRSMPLLVRVANQIYPSLSLQSLMMYGNLTPEQVRIVLGDAIYLEGETLRRRIPINDSGQYFINYRFGLEDCNSFGYYPLSEGYKRHYLENDPQPGLPPVEGKILLVGQLSTGLTDKGVTPFDAETPLVLVHANIIDNVLREDYAIRGPWLPVLVCTLLLGITGMVFFAKRPLWQQALFAFGVPVVYLGACGYLWIRWSLWLPMLWPVIGFSALQIFMIVRQLIREQQSKQHIKGMFGTYLSPELVSRMIESGQSPKLGGHEENITAYFSDIQSFSAFSEKLAPEQLVVLMNEYLSACTDIIQEEGGTLDKYIGDAVVAMFGAPLPLPDHALRACVASQRIHLKLAELRMKWKNETGRWPDIVHAMQSRIGLNSGPVIVGNIGSRTRFNYTMMGDNVNLAARMESGSKSWGVYSMCSEATKLACERDGGDRVVFRPLGRVIVKGRTQAVPIFEIVGLKENVTEQTRECLRLFEQGLARYYARDWDGALEFFRQSRELEPNQPGVTPGVMSNPSRIYIEIVNRYKLTPPPDGWEGEYLMMVK